MLISKLNGMMIGLIKENINDIIELNKVIKQINNEILFGYFLRNTRMRKTVLTI